MRWGDTLTLEFVKLYLKQECLWNPELPNYKIRAEREKAYFNICTDFQAFSGRVMTVPEVKIKIKNLRSTYSQQVHKILQNSSPDAMYEPSLVWFNEMDRCLKNIPFNLRQSIVSKHRSDPQELDSSGQTWTKTDPETQNEESEDHSDPLLSPSEDNYTFDTTPKIRSSKKSKKKKFKRSKPYYRSSTSNNEEYLHVDTRNADDEFDIYGKFIATQLRQMDLQKALRLQLEIQSLVSEARIADLT